MRNTRITRWFVLLSVVWLFGCAHLEKSVEKNLKIAQQLVKRCESFEQDMPKITARQLLERIEKRLLLACEAQGETCPFGLKAELDKANTWFGSPSTPKEVSDAVSAFSTRLEKFNQSVNRFVADNEGSEVVTRQWTAVQDFCRITPDPQKCGKSLNTLVTTLSSSAKRVNVNGEVVAVDLKGSQEAWTKVLLAIKNSKAELTTTGQQAIRQIDLTLQATDNSLHAIRDVAVEEFRADFFDRLLPTLTAEKVLDFTERQLEPVDRLIDKADQKIYMLGSFAIEASRADIQKHFDGFYVQYLREKFPSTESAVAFARAACVRLGKPTPAGRSVSLIMSFLYSSLTLVDLENREKQACLEDKTKYPGVEETIKEQNCERALANIRDSAEVVQTKTGAPPEPVKGSLEEALNNKKTLRENAANSSESPKDASGDGPPLPPKAIPPQSIYDICLSSELAWRRRVAATGYGSAGAARQASQQVCAEYLVDDEQKRYSQNGSPAQNEVDPQSLALALPQAFDRIAAKVLQLESAGGKEEGFAKSPVLEAKPSAQNFCQSLRSAVRTVSCIDGVDESWIELPAAFKSGRFESMGMVADLRTLSRAIAAYQPGVVKVVVFGTASSTPVRSASLTAALAKQKSSFSLQCAEAGPASTVVSSENRKLAVLRAGWAERVMAGTAPELKSKLMACPLPFQPERGDQSFDRRIAVKLSWKSNGELPTSPVVSTRSSLPAPSELRR